MLDGIAPAAPRREHRDRLVGPSRRPHLAEGTRRPAPRIRFPAIAAATAAALVAVVLAAGSVRLLPGRTQSLLAQAVRAVTPFEFPEQREPQAYLSRAPKLQTAQPQEVAAGGPLQPPPDPSNGGGPAIGRDAPDSLSPRGSVKPAPRPTPTTSTLASRAAPAVPESNGPSSGVTTSSAPPAPLPPKPPRLSASLSGTKSGQKGGDADGQGSAALDANPGRHQLCLTLVMSGIDPVTSVHLHEGSVESGGRVVATFQPTPGIPATCVVVPDRLLKAIRKEPSRYYVEVHTSQFPEGALRGQLTENSR
ncbi:MAG: CHRD domain-containing protein [Acidimicrobiales bacterium]